MGVRPSLPSTGACFHHCRVWKQLWLCRGWVPATVNRGAMLNIQPSGAKRLQQTAVSPSTHLLGGWHWPFITQINTTFAAAPPLFTLTPAPSICTHKPSPTTLSTNDPRLQASCLLSSLLSLKYPSYRLCFIFSLILFTCTSINEWRVFKPGTKFCYALTHIDSQSECITELGPEFPTSTT